jgi:hypothetical protein
MVPKSEVKVRLPPPFMCFICVGMEVFVPSDPGHPFPPPPPRKKVRSNLDFARPRQCHMPYEVAVFLILVPARGETTSSHGQKCLVVQNYAPGLVVPNSVISNQNQGTGLCFKLCVF